MLKGIFINNKKAKDSIYESGRMVYECLLNSNVYSLDYIEIDVNSKTIPTGFDFYFFNYHPITMAWLQTRPLKKDLGFVVTMILEVAPGDAFVLCPEDHFDIYCALDPTIKSRKNLFAFPRPLEEINFQLVHDSHQIPVIGSFGFATKGKGFQHVVEAVNKEFDNAVIRINIPYGDFVPNSREYAVFLGETCKSLAKPGIIVEISHDFMSKEELIRWCASNTLNCFLYDRNMPGLAATTDQAIVSERPLAVSDNDTFRHITSYLKPYPAFSLKDSIENSVPLVRKMKEDWSSQKFRERFEEIISKNYKEKKRKNSGEDYILPLKNKNLKDTLIRKYKKYKRKLKKAFRSTPRNNATI